MGQQSLAAAAPVPAGPGSTECTRACRAAPRRRTRGSGRELQASSRLLCRLSRGAAEPDAASGMGRSAQEKGTSGAERYQPNGSAGHLSPRLSQSSPNALPVVPGVGSSPRHSDTDARPSRSYGDSRMAWLAPTLQDVLESVHGRSGPYRPAPGGHDALPVRQGAGPAGAAPTGWVGSQVVVHNRTVTPRLQPESRSCRLGHPWSSSGFPSRPGPGTRSVPARATTSPIAPDRPRRRPPAGGRQQRRSRRRGQHLARLHNARVIHCEPAARRKP